MINVTINDLIKSYNELTINEKRRELGREIAELSIVIQKLLSDLSNEISLDEKSIDQFNNLYDGNLSESEYLTGLYEDIVKFKEFLGIYLTKMVSENYKESIK